jgi:hypothetical protein
MPQLPRPGQKVRWRKPQEARACGWEGVFGPGPYEVVGLVDHSECGLAAGLVLRTRIGEREIPEVWLALADEPEKPAGGRWAVPVAPGGTGPPLCQGSSPMRLLKRLWPCPGRTSAGDYRDRGQALRQKGEYDRAVASFTAAIRLDPTDAVAYRNRGLAYEEQGQYAQAIADYTTALRLDPQSADAYFQRGNAHFARDDFDRAIADYGRALALDPGLALAYYYRGLAYAEKGDAARGNADQRKAVRLDPALGGR